MGVSKQRANPVEALVAPTEKEHVDAFADPFSDAFDAPAIPRISPTTSREDRASLVSELRDMVQAGTYHVDADVVALAVMNANGRMIPKGDD